MAEEDDWADTGAREVEAGTLPTYSWSSSDDPCFWLENRHVLRLRQTDLTALGILAEQLAKPVHREWGRTSLA